MNRIHLGMIDGAVIILYIIALIVIGVFISKQKTKSGNLVSEDIFLGGRTLPWYKVGLSIFSTNVSPSMLVAYFGAAYTSGMVLANFEWIAWIFLVLLSFLFIPYYLKNKISTMPEFLMNKFGKKSHLFFTYFSMFSSLIVWSSFMLCIGGLVIEQLFGVPVYISTFLIIIIAMSYSLNGGLNSIVHTGMIQSIVLILVSLIIVFVGLYRVGGVSHLVASVPHDYWTLFKPTSDQGYPWHAIWLGYPVLGIWFWCTDQSIVQRTLAAKSIDDGQKGALLVAGLKVIMPFIFILPGIICLVLVKDGIFVPLEKPDHAYISMVYGLLPTGLIGLALGTLLVSIINDVATGLSSFSTVFALDLYAKKINPNASEREVKKMSKKVSIVASIVAALVAIFFSTVDKTLFDLGQSLGTYIAPPAATVFIVGLLWKKATPRAAELTLYFGTFLCLVFGFCQLTGFPNKEFWPHYMLLCFYMMVILVVFMMVVSYFTTNSRKAYAVHEVITQDGEQKYQTSTTVKILWALLALIMLLIYYIFN
jgi:SSS family solute:Na+ symporter